MRLGQLARKLALRPSEIVDFLALRSIQIDSGGNTRLEEEHVNLVLQKFAPNGLQEDLTDAPEEQTKATLPAPAEPIITTLVIEDPANIEPVAGPEEKIEVIKAPKVELSGLKVLGKIELPEIKKKEPAITGEENTSAENPSIPAQEPRREKRAPYVQREGKVKSTATARQESNRITTGT